MGIERAWGHGVFFAWKRYPPIHKSQTVSMSGEGGILWVAHTLPNHSEVLYNCVSYQVCNEPRGYNYRLRLIYL